MFLFYYSFILLFIYFMKEKILTFIRFITTDIWRTTDEELTKKRVFWYKILKTFVLTARSFVNDKLSRKASALTYSTLLAIVPTLALIFAIARGFGFQMMIEQSLIENMPAQAENLERSFAFVNSYLEYAKGGVFVGIGIVVLLYSVWNLFSSIEDVFNEIWQIKKSRPIANQLMGYLSAVIIVPILLIVSSGFSVFVNSSFTHTEIGQIIIPVAGFGMKLVPYIIICIIFSVTYIIIPNTKVKISSALFAGVLAGLAFQALQMFYINGQIWLSSYNKIYGNFAALPLLLLWLQLSFLIFLFGANLAFAFQNNQNYSFETDVQKITRRYKDFLYLVILHLIVKRFENEKPPLTIEEISHENRIPLRLTSSLISKLSEAKILTTAISEDGISTTYLPAFDINKMTVALVFDRLYHLGSENFKVDKNKFGNIWNVVVEKKEKAFEEATKNILVKDL